MSLKKGDFVTFDLTAKIKETDEVFDTTIEEVAKTAKLKSQGDKYEPRLVVLGEGWVLKAIDDALLTMEVGKLSTIEIPPKDGFGERDSAKVKTIPLKALLKVGIRPVVGQRVSYGNQTAVVRSVGSGRVTLDFNQFLAGKTLVYEVTVKSFIEKKQDKVFALIHRRFPTIESDKFKFGINLEVITIEVPNEALNMDGLTQAKRGIATDIQKFFSDITIVNFLESFETPTKVAPPVQK